MSLGRLSWKRIYLLPFVVIKASVAGETLGGISKPPLLAFPIYPACFQVDLHL